MSSMSKLSYFVVDAFTAVRYSGNPAAVVFGADELTDEQLQTIAREFNLSETAFVLNSPTPDAAISLRWFTPATEVDMCGHATLAAVHALIESGRFTSLPDEKGTILPIQTKSGILTTRCERLPNDAEGAFLVWLDLATPKLKKKQCAPKLWGQLLDVPPDQFDMDMPAMQTQDGDLLVFAKTLHTVQQAQPDFRELAKFSRQQRIRGWCLASTHTLTPSISVQSRFFAPAVGIDEDPVTGSVHGPLAAYLVSSGLVPVFRDMAAISCTQSHSSGRAGLVRAVVSVQKGTGYRVRIGGQCTTVMQGQLTV